MNIKSEMISVEESQLYNKFNEGDVLTVTSSGKETYGIYVGNGMVVHSVKNANIDTNRNRSSPLRYLFGPKCYSVTLDKMEDWTHDTQAIKQKLGVPMYSVLLRKRNVEEIVSEALKNVNTETSLNSLDFVKHCIYAWRIKRIAAVVTVVVYACLLADTRCADVLSLLFEQNYTTILLINIAFLAVCVFLAYLNQVPEQIERIADKNTTSKPMRNTGKVMLWKYLVNYVVKIFETPNRLVQKVTKGVSVQYIHRAGNGDIEMLPYSGDVEKKCEEKKDVTAEKSVAEERDITEKKDVREEIREKKCEEKKDVTAEKSVAEERDITEKKDVREEIRTLNETSERKLATVFHHCSKNPGHADFIPIKEFTLQHLPEGYRNEGLHDLIKAVADVTVRVAIRMTSTNRPTFWPSTSKPYPFNNMLERRNLRTCSGETFTFVYDNGNSPDIKKNIFIPDVDFSNTNYKTCPCENCRDSKTPSNVWYEIFVTTATSCVFDEIEAAHTSCTLFYDDDKDNTSVTLNGFSVVEADVENDLTVLKRVTCDITLGEKLHEMSKRKKDLLEKHCTKYPAFLAKLCFIVSHPHGCAKQVTIGQLKDINNVTVYNENIDLTQLTYTTATCPGSSGASVYCTGMVNAHIHSGSLKHGTNYSGIGYLYK